MAGDRSLATIDASFRPHISRSGKCTVFDRGCGGFSLLADRDLEKLQCPGDASDITVYLLAARNRLLVGAPNPPNPPAPIRA